MATNLENRTKIEEELIRLKSEKKELNFNQTYLLENGIVGDDCTNPYEKTKEVYDTLLNTPVREDGGRNALFGFYYQFLVAIDYLAELIEGKWSFMAFEIHDDIVLCKEDSDQSFVRFVQVKTKKDPTPSYSSTDLCRRTEKTFTSSDGKVPKRINDSWLDKLFFNAEIFKGRGEVIQQFQLVTNFTFYVSMPKDAETKNINHYRTNESFSGIDIKEDDPFYKRLKNPVFNSKGDEYSYDNQTGMSVFELLSKTQISEQGDQLGSFRDGIRTRLGDVLSRRIKTEGGATVLNDDINWLIGEMIASCSARDDKLVLFIDKERAMNLESKLMERAAKYSEDFTQLVGNKRHIDEALQKTMQELLNAHPEAIEHLQDIAVTIKKQFYYWVKNDKGNILQLIERFYEGQEESIDFHLKMHKSQRDDSVYALIVVFLLLKIINKDINFSLKHKTILTKEVINPLEEEYDLALLKIDDNYYYEDVVKKLNEIMTRLHIHSHADLLLMTSDAPNKIVIHGVHDNSDPINFNESNMETISLSSPSFPQLDGDTESMSKVTYRFLLIPWYTIESKYARFRRNKEDFLSFKETLDELWGKLIKVGE